MKRLWRSFTMSCDFLRAQKCLLPGSMLTLSLTLLRLLVQLFQDWHGVTNYRVLRPTISLVLLERYRNVWLPRASCSSQQIHQEEVLIYASQPRWRWRQVIAVRYYRVCSLSCWCVTFDREPLPVLFGCADEGLSIQRRMYPGLMWHLWDGGSRPVWHLRIILI